MARRKEPVIPDVILDQLLAGAEAKTAFESNGLLDQLKKALAERALNAEMDVHLSDGSVNGNTRNGYGKKTVLTDSGSLEISIPRDHQSSFDPQLLAKYQRRFPDFDEKVISMYARVMSTREIAGHVRELYGLDVSADLISAATDAVLDEVALWQARPLDPIYPLVFFDALRVKIRDEGHVCNKAVHVALGVRGDGAKEVLGRWIETNEGAKFWLRVMNELKNRGVEDILIGRRRRPEGLPRCHQRHRELLLGLTRRAIRRGVFASVADLEEHHPRLHSKAERRSKALRLDQARRDHSHKSAPTAAPSD